MGEQSGTLTVPGTRRAGILPRRLHGQGGASAVAAGDMAAIPAVTKTRSSP